MKWSEQGNIIIGHLRNGKGHFFFFCFEEEKNILSHVNVGHSSTLYNDNRQQKGLFPLHKLLVSGRKSCFSKKRNKASHCKVKCVSEVVLHRHRGKKNGRIKKKDRGISQVVFLYWSYQTPIFPHFYPKKYITVIENVVVVIVM